MKYYLNSTEEVLDSLGSSFEGLSDEQAASKRERFGLNKLDEAKKIPLIVKFFQQMADPMIIILLAAALVSGVTAFYAHESFADVFIILAVVVINSILGVYQENKAEQAIEALQKMTAAKSRVIRGGRHLSVHSEELVPGDVIVLEAGDAVPADARVFESASMRIEEAALTGESVPVSKCVELLSLGQSKDIPLGDRRNMAYMGSVVVYGRGKAVVTATGMETEMGKIAGALAQTQEGQTPLQIKLAQLSGVLSKAVIGICIFIFFFSLIRSGDFSGEVMLSTFMIAVSLAVAAIPEGLATVVTIVLSIGVTKMAKQNAVIRRLTAVETLGCAQIICSDKTGTLTQNKMTVVDSAGHNTKLLATAMCLCNDAELEDGIAVGEPTEAALVDFAYKLELDKNILSASNPRIGEAPFDSGRKMMSTVHRTAGGIVQYTKGAPDEVLKKCDYVYCEGGPVPLTAELRGEFLDLNHEMAGKALRVLGGACRYWNSPPENFEADTLERHLIFLGLEGLIDPVRPEVKAAVEQCGEAGIRPIMITGDHKDTAVAIAKELGMIDDASHAITGSELDEISDEDFKKEIKNYSVYARVQPEHKVRIVKGWQELGMITAMTGDGVNDAPSIKTADIGVGMGITGTDVTKNVADMVLADDNFATIVSAVKEGRRIYANIRKSIQFLLSSNLSEVLSIFFATLMGFVILKPVHLLWINLITDAFPALALGMEDAEEDIMSQRPRPSRESIFADGMGVDIIYQGAIVTALTLAAYFIGHYIESGRWEIANSADGMTMAFLTMSMCEIFHSFNLRSRKGSIFTMPHQNRYLIGAMLLSLVLTTAVIYVPFLASSFSFTPISLFEYFAAMGLAISIIPMVEIIKLFMRKHARAKS